MSKLNRILAAILLFQAALVVYVYWPKPQASAGEPKPLFADLEKGRITSLTLFSEPVSKGGKSLELIKNGESWTIPSKDNYPADNDRVNGLLDKIASLNTKILVAKTKSSHRRLKVAEDEYNRMVEMRYVSGDEPKRLYLGSSPAYRKVHIRNGIQNEVYLTKDIAAWEVGAEVATWMNHKYLDLQADNVSAITIENSHGRLEFEKSGDGSWTLNSLKDDEKINQSSWKTLLGKALSIRMMEPLGRQEQKSYAMEKPSVSIVIKTSDGSDITLKAGAKDEEKNSYVVKSSESPFYVRVSGYTIEDLISARKDNLLEVVDPDSGADKAE